MSSMPTAAPPAAPPALSETQRIVNTFIAPSKTFTDLRCNSRWWAPWIVLAIAFLAFMAVIDQKVGFDQIAHTMTANSSRAAQMEQLPPDQRARQYGSIARFTRVLAYASPVTTLIAYLIVAAVLMATFRFGAGAELGYKTSLAIVMYSALPFAISALVGILSLSAGANPENFNLNNPVASNPAYFMDMAGNKFFYTLASALDVFTIWSIVLMAIGFARNNKLRVGTCFTVIASWYLLWKLLAAGLALLS
ncbi:MAG TPA: YIP1 family protein [Terriglobales bacterium]|nr:YIP1 family protein [Terriglobales bacterium]